MTTMRSTEQCSACDEDHPTFQYHDKDLQRIALCKSCYDVYMAKEMAQYWKDHIQEEMRRTGKS